MYLMYVDESGDSGIVNSPSKYFVLSALVIHETNWQKLLDDTVDFRRYLKNQYGLLMREEIHASVFINGHPKLKNRNISKNHKTLILQKCLKFLNDRNDIDVFSVCCDKSKQKENVFDYVWQVFIQRFENTLLHNNFREGFKETEKGMVLSDNTDGGKVTKILRKMRHFNPIPNKNMPGSRNQKLKSIIEDPVLKDSAQSYIVQLVDVVAYFARQFYEPNKYIRKKGCRTYYNRFLENVINRNVTTNNKENYIVNI
jgi:hypothetical protein